MKICPTCRKTYEDASLRYCLDDGAGLREITENDPDATRVLPQSPGPTVVAPRSTVPVQATLTARPEQFQAARSGVSGDEPESSRKSAMPWIFGIVVVLAVSGVLVAWLLTSGKNNQVARNEQPSPAVPTPTVDVERPQPTPEATKSPANTPTPERSPTVEKPKATPEATQEKPKPMFSVLNNMTFNGSRITYYPRPSFGQCQADCAANGNCRGFTWIRPGAYNPGDSAMCYLMSAVTDRVPHNCCISAVRN